MLLEYELINKCIRGNKAAQKELYEKYSPLFFAMCMRYMPTSAEAEDVLVMGFTTIFAKLDTFNDEGTFESWMRKIIVNTAIDTLRMNNMYYKTIKNSDREDLEENIFFSTSANTIYGQMNIKYIMEQIQQLSVGYRMIFNLYAIEGYSYEEISSIMEINVGTVRSQLAKARKVLQNKLKDFKR